MVGADGFVDRKVLGARVFGKPDEMNKLTTAIGSITEAIKAEIDRWREELPPHAPAVMEAVNLMEPGYGRWCDQVWLIAADDEVDAMNREMYTLVQDGIRANPDQMNSLIHMLSISRHLERIADQATNIAEDVIYMVEGEIVRHRAEKYLPQREALAGQAQIKR